MPLPLHNTNLNAAMMEPSVGVARVAVEAPKDYATPAVPYSFVAPNNTRGMVVAPSTSTITPSIPRSTAMMVLPGRQDNHAAAKRKSAVASSNHSVGSSTSARSAPASVARVRVSRHDDHTAAKREWVVTSSTASVGSSTSARSAPLSAGMNRVSRHDDYQNTKLFSLDKQVKAAHHRNPRSTFLSDDDTARMTVPSGNEYSQSITSHPTKKSHRPSAKRTSHGNELAFRTETKSPNRTRSFQMDNTSGTIANGGPLRNSKLAAGQRLPGVAMVPSGAKDSYTSPNQLSMTMMHSEMDARITAGLRNARTFTEVGAVPMMRDNSAEKLPARLTQGESDARANARLRNARATVTTVGAVPMMDDSSTEKLPTRLSQSQSEADPRVEARLQNSQSRAPVVETVPIVSGTARVKAGLRNPHSRRATVAGAVPMLNGYSVEEVPYPTILTQVESDARVKAGLQNAKAAVIGEVPFMNDQNSEEVSGPTRLANVESDARIKAGLRNRRTVKVVGAVEALVPLSQFESELDPRVNAGSRSTPEGEVPMVESDVQIKAGLRKNRVVAVVGAAPLTKFETQEDPRVKAEVLRQSRTDTVQPGAVPVPGVGTQVVNNPELAASIALLDQHGRSFLDSGSPMVEEGALSARLRDDGNGYRTIGFCNDGDGDQIVLVPDGDYDPVQAVQPAVKNEAGNGNRRRRYCCIIFIVVVIVIVVLAVVVFMAPSGDVSGTPEESELTGSPVVILTDVFPTTALPGSTAEALESKSDRLPQVQAYNWLLNDPNLSKYSEAQRLQRFALATFYFATNGQDWFPEGEGNNWLQYDVHECNWLSLSPLQEQAPCRGFDSTSSLFDHSEYVSLVLSGESTNGPSIYRRVKGTLPPELSLLTSLERLNLGLQKLRGPIPDLGTLSSTLRHIVLYDNDLTGTIPSSLFTFPETLWLSVNSLSESTIPTSVGLNSNLSSLFLISCKLTGSIPPEMFQSKPNLNLLWLDQNSLDGSLPSEIGLATALQQFRIVENKISGRIPTEVGLLPGMLTLWLGLNRLSGSLVTELGNLVELQVS
jgi:hypothetical protein